MKFQSLGVFLQSFQYTVDPDRTGEKLGTIDSSLLHARDSLDEFRKELDLPIPDRREPEEIIIDLQDQLEQKNDIIIALQGNLGFSPIKHVKFLFSVASHTEMDYKC